MSSRYYTVISADQASRALGIGARNFRRNDLERLAQDGLAWKPGSDSQSQWWVSAPFVWDNSIDPTEVPKTERKLLPELDAASALEDRAAAPAVETSLIPDRSMDLNDEMKGLHTSLDFVTSQRLADLEQQLVAKDERLADKDALIDDLKAELSALIQQNLDRGEQDRKAMESRLDRLSVSDSSAARSQRNQH